MNAPGGRSVRRGANLVATGCKTQSSAPRARVKPGDLTKLTRMAPDLATVGVSWSDFDLALLLQSGTSLVIQCRFAAL